MSDYLNMARSDPERLQAWLKQNHVNAKKVGKRLYLSNVRQIHEDNLFHGDLHPGNIVLLRNSRIAFIDFGSIGSSDPDFLEKHFLFFEAMVLRQFAKVFDLYMLFPDNIPAIDFGALKEEFIQILQSWDELSQVSRFFHEERPFNPIGRQLPELLGRYGITMPWQFLRSMRAVNTLDAALRELITYKNMTDFNLSFLKRHEQRILRQNRRKQQRKPSVNTLPASIINTPISLHETMIFRGAVVRRLAQVFEGMTSKVSVGIDSVFRIATLCIRVLMLVFVLTYAQQYQVAWLTSLIHETLSGLLRRLPRLDMQIWLFVGGAMLYCDRVLVNLRQRFRES